MLLGCCHCEGYVPPPSESLPPSESSQSLDSRSVSSSSESLIDLIGAPCDFCIALPAAWRVTVSGVAGQSPADNTCCGSYNQSYILTWRPVGSRGSVAGISPGLQCGYWKSDENIKRFWAGFPTPAYCSEFSGGGRVVMCATADSASVGLFVGIIYSQSGPANIQERSYGLVTTNCLYSGALSLINPGTGQKCTAATVSIAPA